MMKRALLVSLAFVVCTAAATSVAQGQSSRPPLLQDIKIKKADPEPSATPLIKRTGSSKPVSLPPELAASRRTTLAALAEIDIPGNSGILIESEDGRVVFESYADETFNPASNVKVATAYAVLRSFGPDFRFLTGVWTDGRLDLANATLVGDLYVSGRDPIFGYEHGMAIAHELNRMGIRKVEGNVIVTGNFVMNYNRSARSSGYTLIKTMDMAKRGASSSRAWDNYLKNSGKYRPGQIVPSVEVTGDLEIGGMPAGARLLFSHESAKLREILKVTLSYSNNFLAARLGEMVGGPHGVERIVRQDISATEDQFSLQTSSGLGINRVSPRAQVALLRRTKHLLRRYGMKLSDILPVAGLDDGTLRGRFTEDLYRGSVVGKTGTLRRTDHGVSSLSGEFATNQGRYFFVIFNQKGGVIRFRNFQNLLVPLAQSALGGARPLAYTPVQMEKRLATTKIKHSTRKRISLD